VETAVYMDVDCPRCSATATHDVPAREAGRTDYPVTCPSCGAKFELWLDPQWFM
jgi:transposase-like protein